MTVYRARWVLPVSQPPIRDGYVIVERGRIVDVGRLQAGTGRVKPVAILPGLVNAHTHLELSYLHERIPSQPRFGSWVRAVMDARRRYPDPSHPDIIGAADRSIADATATGTILFGEVSNTLVTAPLLRARGGAAQVFHELTGFTEQDPHLRVREARERADAAAGGDVRISVAPHAPYSVSADLFQAIRADLDRHPSDVSSVHLGETPEEVELLRRGSGEIKAVLQELGRWPPDWRPPGVGPVEYLSSLGMLGPRMLVVHGVQFDSRDLDRLRDLGATVVTCPRSNVYVGVGSPPLEQFYAAGLQVAIGTDSLASVADLNLFAELGEARRIAPRVPARRLLESATLSGARALGFAADFGSLEPGKRAALLALALPAAVDDVEEYLVGGVQPSDIRWLDADNS